MFISLSVWGVCMKVEGQLCGVALRRVLLDLVTLVPLYVTAVRKYLLNVWVLGSFKRDLFITINIGRMCSEDEKYLWKVNRFSFMKDYFDFAYFFIVGKIYGGLTLDLIEWWCWSVWGLEFWFSLGRNTLLCARAN